MELVCRVGHIPEKYGYSDVRLERRGFLSIVSFRATATRSRQEIMERGHAVVILPIDPARRELFFIEQPRHAKVFVRTEPGRAALAAALAGGQPTVFETASAEACTYEVPAGIIDPGETPEQAAIREMAEETGFEIGPEALTQVTEFFPSIGAVTESAVGFVARLDGSKAKPEACGDGGETIRVWKCGWSEAFDLMRQGKFQSASSQLLLRWLETEVLREQSRT